MTTNIERAADLIANATIPLGTSIARGVDRAILAAQTLADAGLLMPDQPESSWPNGIPTNRDSISDLYTSDGKVYAIINAGYDHYWEELTPDEAIEWAYDLIAAARQAQEQA